MYFIRVNIKYIWESVAKYIEFQNCRYKGSETNSIFRIENVDTSAAHLTAKDEGDEIVPTLR